MRILDIIPGTSVDGPGLRTSIYLAGCHHQCPGCHNPQSWDFNGGTEMTADEILAIVEENGFNVTFTGGDPMYHAEALYPLASELKNRGYNLWLYTGFTFEQLMDMPAQRKLLNIVDVVVDGPFVQALRDIHLRFRGSSNQRIIDAAQSLAAGVAVDFEFHD